MKANKHTTRWIVAQQVPPQVNANGMFLVGTTSMALDAVVAVFNSGAIAAEITERYLSLKLADDLVPLLSNLNHQVEAGGRQRQQQAPALLVGELNQRKFHPLFKGDRVLLHVSHS